ncbi:MAG: MFS transporter [Chloroflexota bacterium]|nr:MAG: MFS transporter [Chloroflexota bacterium]
MRPRASSFEIVRLNTYWLGLSFMWNSLHVIILPALLLNFAPENQKNTYLGLMTFFGLIIAMLVQPISGSISDRWASRWGRRRPLIFLGTLFDFLFLALLGWAGGLAWLAIGYMGLQLSSNIAHGPAQGLLPDRVPPEQVGAASGVKNLMDMVGLVVSSLLMGRFMAPGAQNAIGPVALVMAVLAFGACVTLLGVRETPTTPPVQPANKVSWREGLKVDFKAHSSYWWLIASRLAFLLGIYDIQVFAQYYVRDVIATPNPVKLTGDLLAAITVGLIAFALAGGWLGDRLGHKRVLAIAGFVAAAGCLLMLAARTPATLLVFGSVVGAGIGLFLTSNWALANSLAPGSEAGKFLGLTNIATAGSGAIARLAGPFIDIGNNAMPGAFWGYTGMFIFGAVCTLFSVVLLKKVIPTAAPASPAWSGD